MRSLSSGDVLLALVGFIMLVIGSISFVQHEYARATCFLLMFLILVEIDKFGKEKGE